MRRLGAFLAVAAVMAVFAVRAGHEMPIYPSYYPQEISIRPLAPAAAGAALAEGRIQAHVGRAPVFQATPDETMKSVETLGGFVVVDVNPDSPKAAGGGGACALAQAVVGALAEGAEDFRFHPYPVNGYHADYLYHADRAVRARERVAGPPGAGATGLTVRAEGAFADALARRRWPEAAGAADATLRVIDLDRLLAARRTTMNGWLGPPWLKQGWFHAYLLLADTLSDPMERARAEALVARLETGAFDGEAARINGERDLVQLLTGGCRRTVAGYRVRREVYNSAFTGGVENIAYDSHAGFNSAIFVRTVKLKDFPWNGWLALGIDGAPEAAWNPLAGFTDPAGRLIWWAVGDPALFPEAYDAGWTANRADVLGDAAPKKGPGR